MIKDLKLTDTFFVKKDIFFNPKVNRRSRAIYVTLSLFSCLGFEATLKRLAKASGYNEQIARLALKDLNKLGFVNLGRNFIEIVK
jgi:hypothetical protein